MNEYTIRLCNLSTEVTFGMGIKRLIKKGADPNMVVESDGTTLLMKHLEGYTSFVTLLKFDLELDKQTKTGETVLIKAAETDYEGFVKRLLKKGAAPNITDNKGRTALLAAASSGCVKSIEQLLKHKANLHHKDHNGDNALFYAVKENNPDMIRFLAKKGIDLNHKNKKGFTALFNYLYNETYDEDHFESVQMLIKSGADVNFKNKKEETPLELAAQYGFHKTVQLLLENSADIHDKTQNILTKLRKDRDHFEEILKLIKDSGAKQYPFIAQYKTKFKCNSCGRMIAVNSPTQKITCIHCHSHNKIDDIIWEGFIDFSCYQDFKYNYSFERENYLYIDMKRTEPICSNSECRAKLDHKKIKTGSEDILICPKCGKKYLTFPAPDWLKKFDLNGSKASQIICEEKETSKPDKQVFKTTAVYCLSCGASMKFSKNRPRLSNCEHCGTNQYLPDSIWKTLHPYKIRKAWYIMFE